MREAESTRGLGDRRKPGAFPTGGEGRGSCRQVGKAGPGKSGKSGATTGGDQERRGAGPGG